MIFEKEGEKERERKRGKERGEKRKEGINNVFSCIIKFVVGGGGGGGDDGGIGCRPWFWYISLSINCPSFLYKIPTK